VGGRCAVGAVSKIAWDSILRPVGTEMGKELNIVKTEHEPIPPYLEAAS
jgi:hypothetical protein